MRGLILLGIVGLVLGQSDTIPKPNDTIEPVSNTLVLSNDDLDNTDEPDGLSQSVLQANKSVLDRVQSYDWNAYMVSPQNLGWGAQTVSINGIPMQSFERRSPQWHLWSGLNDITKNIFEQSSGNVLLTSMGQGLQGGVQFHVRPSGFRAGHTLHYTQAQRLWQYRLGYGFHTGLSSKGWAFSLATLARYGQNSLVDGTFMHNASLYLGLEKQTNRHQWYWTFLIAPEQRALQSAYTQEVYDLKGPTYNGNWGWQDGRMRSARIRSVLEPLFQWSHQHQRTHTLWHSTASVQSGIQRRSYLNYYTPEGGSFTSSPWPTYYRYLPSFDSDNAQWVNDSSLNQIQWADLYRQNIASGVARYFMTDDVIRSTRWAFQNHIQYQKGRIKLTHWGLIQHYKAHYYAQLTDLLGADFALNLDAFNQYKPYNQDAFLLKVHLNDPIFYSYGAQYHQMNEKITGSVQYAKGHTRIGVMFQYQDFQRQGYFNNHSATVQNPSVGYSPVMRYWSGQYQIESLYKLGHQHQIQYHGLWMNQPPQMDQVFYDLAYTQRHMNLPQSHQHRHQLRHQFRWAQWQWEANAYTLWMKNGSQRRQFYADLNTESASVTELVTQIDQWHYGVDAAIEYSMGKFFKWHMVGAWHRNIWTNDPMVWLYSIDQGLRMAGLADITNELVSGSPQKAWAVGVKYQKPKWWIGATGHWFDKRPLGLSYLLRTPLLHDNNPSTIQALAPYLVPEWAPATWVLNISAGRTFSWKGVYSGIILNVQNALNKPIATGGYEQSRYANAADFIQDQSRAQPWYDTKYYFNAGLQFSVYSFVRF